MANKNKKKKNEVVKKDTVKNKKNKNKESEIIEIDDVVVKEYDPNKNSDLNFNSKEDSHQADSDHNNKKDDHHGGNKKKSPFLIFLLLAVLFFGVYYYVSPHFFNNESKKTTSAAPKKAKNDLDFINNRAKNAQKEKETKKDPLPKQPSVPSPNLVVNPVVNNFEEKKISKGEKEKKENEEKEKEAKRLNDELSKYISDQVQETLKKFDEKENSKEFSECLLFLKESDTKKVGDIDKDSKKVLLDFEKEKESCRGNLETKAKGLKDKFEMDLENLLIAEEKLDIFKREAGILYENYRKDFAILVKKADTDYSKLIDKVKSEIERIKKKEEEGLKKSIQEKAKKIVQNFTKNAESEAEKFYKYVQNRAEDQGVKDILAFFEQEGKASDLNEKFLDLAQNSERDYKKIIKDFEEEINILSERNENEKFDEEAEKIEKKYKEKVTRLFNDVKGDFEFILWKAETEIEELKKKREEQAGKNQEEQEQKDQEEQAKKDQEDREQKDQEEQARKDQEENEKDSKVDLGNDSSSFSEPSEDQKNADSIGTNDIRVDDEKDDARFNGAELFLRYISFLVFYSTFFEIYRFGECLRFFSQNAKDISQRMTVSFNEVLGCNIVFPTYTGFFFYPLFLLFVWYVLTTAFVFLFFLCFNIKKKRKFKFKNIVFAFFYSYSKFNAFNGFLSKCFLVCDLLYFIAFFNWFYYTKLYSEHLPDDQQHDQPQPMVGAAPVMGGGGINDDQHQLGILHPIDERDEQLDGDEGGL